MAKDRKTNIVIGAKDQASKKIGKVKSSLGGLQGAVLTAGAAWLSWRAATAIWNTTVTAAGEQESIMNRLKNAVEITGQSYADNAPMIKKFLTEMQATTVYGDTEMAVVLQQLTTLTGDFGQATLDASEIAADMAASGLFNLETATRYVGMAMGGNVEMLGRYIPEMKASAGLIDQNMTASEKWAVAQDVLAEKFGGMAAGELNTFQGRLKEMNNALQDAGEALGDILLPALTSIAATLTPLIKAFGSFIEFMGSDQITNGANDMRKFADAMSDIEGSIELMADIEDATKEYKATVAELVGEIERQEDANEKVYKSLQEAFDASKPGYLGVTHLQEVLNEKAEEYRDTIEEIKERHREKTEAVIEDLGEEEEKLTIIDGNIRKRAVGLMDFQRKIMLEEMAYRKQIEQDKLNRVTYSSMRIMQLHRDLCEDIVEQMWGAQANFREIFKEMAKDFIKYFIIEVTKQLAIAVGKWVATLIFFDVRANDLKVIQMGRDYARYFQQGVFEGMDTGRLAGGMAGRMLPAGGAVQIGAAVPASSVNIYIQGNIIGQDEYVYDQLIPAIEEAVTRKESNLVVG